MCKLSFIVPVYNVEKYLRKCVDSLLAQNFEDYEIILVDDGSTDKCPAICDEYARKSQESRVKSQEFPLIQVIHRENGGLSAARNSGIKIAKGEYIMFVDSDDYLEKNVLCSLMEQIERDNLDVLRYNFQNVRITDGVQCKAYGVKYETFEPFKDAKRDVNYSESVVDGETFLNECLGPGCYAWQFVLRRDLIISNDTSNPVNNLLFKEGVYFEDTEWTPRMLMRAKRVASTPTIVYNYLWRSGSITLPTDPVKCKKVLDDKIKLLYGFQEQSKLVCDPKWFIWMTSFNTMTILSLLAMMPSMDRKPYLQELKLLNIFPLSTEREKILSHKIKIHLANISPNLYCVIMSLKG